MFLNVLLFLLGVCDSTRLFNRLGAETVFFFVFLGNIDFPYVFQWLFDISYISSVCFLMYSYACRTIPNAFLYFLGWVVVSNILAC